MEITGGDPCSTRPVHAPRRVEGGERVLDDEALGHWVEMNRLNAKKLNLEGDAVVVHDVQPASVIASRPGGGRWVWECHFDCSSPQRRAWSVFRALVDQYDGAIFALPQFGRRLSIPQYVVQPSIDPLSDKNRELSPREVARILQALAIPQDRPLLVQIGRFTRYADPLGVVKPTAS